MCVCELANAYLSMCVFTCACVRECVRSCVLVFVSEYAYFPASERSIVRPFVCTCANSFAMTC